MLLSYSSMRKFLECPRKWALEKLDNLTVEGEINIPMTRGRAFHECVEMNDPSLVMKNPDLDLFDKQLIYHAVIKYAEVAETIPKPTMKEVKIINEEHGFIGFKDSVTINDDNTWLIGEMKTSARLDPIEWATYQVSHQVGLYKAMCGEWCKDNFLAQEDFAGCSFKKIVFGNKKPRKGRGKNAVPETPEAYIEWAKKDIQVYHQIFKVSEEVQKSALQTFFFVKNAIEHLGNKSENFPKCQNSCKNMYGICEFFEHCWQISATDTDEETNIEYD